MRVAIRLDVSDSIGTGHFMRCLSLAYALKKINAEVHFFCSQLPSYLMDLLYQGGIEFHCLGNRTVGRLSPQGFSSNELLRCQIEDAGSMSEKMGHIFWDWLIVDHYLLDAGWEASMRQHVDQILVVDDLANRDHDCDVLLDQNFYADMHSRYSSRVSAGCVLLLGPRYALLRECFSYERRRRKDISEIVKRLFVFFGGADRDNYTELAVKALTDSAFKGIEIDVVMGAGSPNIAAVERACAKAGFNLHIQPSNIAELMLNADLALGSGGSVTWERCCVGLPTLAFAIADNQRELLADAAKEGFLLAPSFDRGFHEGIKSHTLALIDNYYLRVHFSKSSLDLVDGEGAGRVAKYMMQREIKIRGAEKSDALLLYEWRSHPDIMRVSLNKELFSYESHIEWVNSTISSVDRLLLIGELFSVPVGVVRFDLKPEGSAEISIYMAPDNKKKGLGGGLLRLSEEWLRINYPNISEISAVVMGDNIPSKELFKNAGYEPLKTHYLKSLN